MTATKALQSRWDVRTTGTGRAAETHALAQMSLEQLLDLPNKENWQEIPKARHVPKHATDLREWETGNYGFGTLADMAVCFREGWTEGAANFRPSLTNSRPACRESPA